MAYNQHIKDLFDRLRKIGFDAEFLRSAVLPDWWDDEMAAVPANRAMAEMSIARHLGLTIAKLRDPSANLTMPAFSNLRLKRSKTTATDEALPAMLVARHAADLIAGFVHSVGPFQGPMTAQEVRRAILKHNPSVNLKSLLRFAWRHGVPTIHLGLLPKPSKKIDGMALFCQARPVIVLASAKDSPPWLAFHLAHELAHILLSHVSQEQPAWADATIGLSEIDNDDHESEADRFACELLTGDCNPSFAPTYGLTGPKLANAAREYGRKHGISPGIVALFYGRTANRWGAAQLALKQLGKTHGGQRIISEALWEHLDKDDVPESSERFLTVLSEAA